MIADILHKVAGMEKEERQLYRPRPSLAGPERCLRQMVYWAFRVPEDKQMADRFVMVLDDSSFQEAITEDWINKSAFQLHSQQMEVECIELSFMPEGKRTLRGSIDGIITDMMMKDRHYEHKSLNHFSFERYWAGTLPLDYITQCCLYQIGLRKLNPEIDETVLLIRNKNTSAYIDYLILYDAATDTAHIREISHSNGKKQLPKPGEKFVVSLEKIVTNAVERFRLIEQHLKDGTLPDREYEPGDWQCQYCSWGVETCWAGYEEEYKALATHKTLTGEIEAIVDKYAELGEQGKVAEEEKESLRGQMLEIFTEADQYLAEKFTDLVAYYLETHMHATNIEEDREKVKAQILEVLKAEQSSKVKVGPYMVHNQLQKRTKLDKEQIPADILAQATIPNPVHVLRVTKPKEKAAKGG